MNDKQMTALLVMVAVGTMCSLIMMACSIAGLQANDYRDRFDALQVDYKIKCADYDKLVNFFNTGLVKTEDGGKAKVKVR